MLLFDNDPNSKIIPYFGCTTGMNKDGLYNGTITPEDVKNLGPNFEINPRPDSVYSDIYRDKVLIANRVRTWNDIGVAP